MGGEGGGGGGRFLNQHSGAETVWYLKHKSVYRVLLVH